MRQGPAGGGGTGAAAGSPRRQVPAAVVVIGGRRGGLAGAYAGAGARGAGVRQRHAALPGGAPRAIGGTRTAAAAVGIDGRGVLARGVGPARLAVRPLPFAGTAASRLGGGGDGGGGGGWGCGHASPATTGQRRRE